MKFIVICLFLFSATRAMAKEVQVELLEAHCESGHALLANALERVMIFSEEDILGWTQPDGQILIKMKTIDTGHTPHMACPNGDTLILKVRRIN